MPKAVEEERIKNKKEKRENGALFIPAGLFLGMGLGFVLDKFIGGLFIGLGVGFLLFALTNILKKKN
jgi:hypothetical protein